MDSMTRSMKGFPWGGFSAIFATALLFTALPLLTRIEPGNVVKNVPESIFIDAYKPPPPPPEDRNAREKPEMIEKAFPERNEKPERTKPKMDAPKAGPAEIRNGTGWVVIDVTPRTEITISKRKIAYDPNEVDQPPRYLRTFQPQYPYPAKRDHIEGKVLLRFVVDLDGLAKEVEVVEADPPGFFEEAALKAIKRYKFRPAVKDGEAVMCNAALTITFVLD